MTNFFHASSIVSKLIEEHINSVSQTANLEGEVLDIEPHGMLKFNSPDTVAECFPNIDEDLYNVLWSMTQYYEHGFSFKRTLDADLEKNNTALFWDKFTYEQKVALNEAAERNQRCWEGE